MGANRRMAIGLLAAPLPCAAWGLATGLPIRDREASTLACVAGCPVLLAVARWAGRAS